MKENNCEKIINEHDIKRIFKQKNFSENSFNTFRNFYHSDRSSIKTYIYKDKMKNKNYFFNNNNFNTTRINENSTKLNSIKLTNSSNFIRSRIEESTKTRETCDKNHKQKIINLKNIFNSNHKIKNNILYSSKSSIIVNNKNKYTKEDKSGIKRYLLRKFNLIGNIQNKEKTFHIVSHRKYFSLTNIQRYSDLIKFKSIKKKLFNNSIKNEKKEINLNNISLYENKAQKDFLKDVNGIYLLKKFNLNFSKNRKEYLRKKLNKLNKTKIHKSHLDIYDNIETIKLKINEDNNNMKKNIENEFSELSTLKNSYNAKRPNENTHKGLEQLYYLYNKKRAKDEKIVTNRILDDEEKYSNLAEMMPLKDKKINNNIKIINPHNIIYIAQNKVNKLFHDLLIFQLPKLPEEKYIRKVLYDIFIEFKNLLLLSMMKNKDIDIYKKGIDFNTFFNCNTKINQQGRIIAKKMFQVFNNNMDTKYMNLNSYIDGMLKIKDSNKENKLNLFFEILDNNSDGCLTYDEIYKLSIICLQKITLNIEEEDDIEKLKNDNNKNDIEIVKGLAEYFCKMIFKLVNIDIKEKIPTKLLKKMIIQGGEQADYIELLFGSSNFT